MTEVDEDRRGEEPPSEKNMIMVDADCCPGCCRGAAGGFLETEAAEQKKTYDDSDDNNNGSSAAADDDWRRHMYSKTSACSNSSLGQGSDDMPDPEMAATQRFYGDFYYQDEDVFRSVVQQPEDDDDDDDNTANGSSSFPTNGSSSFQRWSTKYADLWRESAAPLLSSLWPFTVAVTHIELQYASPPQAFQQCVTALQKHSGVCLHKVRPHKYTVKGSFFASPGFECDFKVFIYSTADGAEDAQAASCEGAVLEFQRRNGDCLAFSELFKHMRRVLTGEDETNAEAAIDWKVFECSRLATSLTNENAVVFQPQIQMALDTPLATQPCR